MKGGSCPFSKNSVQRYEKISNMYSKMQKYLFIINEICDIVMPNLQKYQSYKSLLSKQVAINYSLPKFTFDLI